MPGVYRLSYRDGRSEDHFGHRGYFYVLSGEKLLAFYPNPVWCHTCKAITLGETLRSKADIEEELRQIEDPNSEWYRSQRRPPKEKDVSFWKKCLTDLLVLWEERQSPAKCLRCFQPTVSQFVYDKWTPHPETGEEILFECVGMCSTDFAMRFFSPDCIELPLSEEEHERLFERVSKERIF